MILPILVVTEMGSSDLEDDGSGIAATEAVRELLDADGQCLTGAERRPNLRSAGRQFRGQMSWCWSAFRRKQEAALDSWLETAATCLLASFARGLAQDHHAGRAAISSASSNAQAKGQINMVKLVKSQIYG